MESETGILQVSAESNSLTHGHGDKNRGKVFQLHSLRNAKTSQLKYGQIGKQIGSENCSSGPSGFAATLRSHS